ncbi:hypothetical protein [Phnomibacter sp. MR]|uniref:hypothetical protein n=1 Tax=Phnomibacter sp. MR TaxID=3042318 RepID=UPI003A80FAA8
MNNNTEMEERLWQWIDGQCSAAEVQELQQLVQQNDNWRALHAELLALHISMQQDAALLQPSMRFTKNVMEQIAAMSIQTTAKTYLNNKIIYGVAGIFITMLVIALAAAFSAVNWKGGESSLQLPVQNITGTNWGQWLGGQFGTIASVLFAVAALALLDQYLRPKLLQKK